MNDHRTTSPPPAQDDLVEAYHRASELSAQASRPSQTVRDRILAQAEAQARLQAPATPVGTHRPAANESRWKLRALASVMVMGFAGLLAWQVERAPPEPDQAPPASAARPDTPREAPGRPAAAPADIHDTAPAEVALGEAAPAAQKTAPAPARRQADAPVRQPPAPAAAAEPASPAPAPAAVPPRPVATPPAPAAVAAARPPVADPFPAAPASPAPQAGGLAARAPLERAERTEGADPAPSPAAAESLDRSTAEAADQYTAKSAASRIAQERRLPAPAAAAAAPLASATPEPRSRDTRAASTESSVPLWQAAARADLDAVRAALASGTSPDAVDPDGRPALVVAVVQGDGGLRHQAVVRALIAAGADPTRKDREGLNAVDHARRLGQSGMLQALQAPR
jgi:hypothetical protein